MADLNLALRIRGDLQDAQRALQRMEKELDDSGKAADKTRREIDGLSRSGNKLRNVFAAVGGTLLLRQLVRATDTYTNLQSQLGLVTDSQEQLNEVFDATYQIAQDTRQGLEPTVSLYARLARSTEDLDLQQSSLLAITKAVNQSLVISGASAEESAAAVIQFSQGLNEGMIRGEEFNSVVSAAPRLAQALADGLGRPRSELRGLAEEGKLTADVVTRALLRTADEIDEEFRTMPRTVGQALQQLRNDLLVTFGQADASGLVDGVDELREIVTDPAFQQGVLTLANGFFKLVSQAGKFAEITEYFLQNFGVTAPDPTDIRDLRQLESEIRDTLNSGPISRIKLFGPNGAIEYYDEQELRAELADVQRRIQEALAVENINRDIDNPIANATNALGQQLEQDRRSQPIQLGDGGKSDKEAEKRAEKQAEFVAELEREVELFEASEAATRRYEISQMDLTGELEKRAQAADAALRKQEELKQQAEDDAEVQGLYIRLLRSQGNDVEAARQEFERDYGELLQRLEQRGDESGRRIVNNLLNMTELQAKLSDAEREINQTMDDLARREQSINVQREAGVISEVEARRELLDLHRETAAVLEQQRPLLEELAQQPGQVGESAQRALQAMNAQVQELNSTTTLLQETLQGGLERGISSALTGLADGTMNLRDAVSQLGQSVADSLADMAAQGLSQSITGSLFGGGFGALFAASGGHVRGPGTGTSDSIPAMLSDKEFVTRASVTTQPGALDFLHEFNKRGMSVLDDIGAARHNTGGLAGVPAPSMGPPSLGKATLSEPAKAFSAEVSNKFNFNLIDDPERISSAMRSRAGEEAISVMISRNPQKFRQLLKV